MDYRVKIYQALTQAELESARALFREYAASLPFDLGFQSFDEELEHLPGEYTPPRGRLLLVEVDHVLAGCVAVRPIDCRICEMKRLYVRPAQRGKGLGRHLAGAAIEAARAEGYEVMRLDTVDSMHAAITLYRSLGFEEIPPYRFNPVDGARYFEIPLPVRSA